MPPSIAARAVAVVATAAVVTLEILPSTRARAAQAPSPPPPARVHQIMDTTTGPPPAGLVPGGRATGLSRPRRPLGSRPVIPPGQRATAADTTPASAAPLPDPEVLGFAQAGEVSSGSWRSDLRMDLLSTIAYFGVVANPDGTLQTSDSGYAVWRSQATTDLINAAHAAGDRVVLTVKDFSDSSITQLTASETARQTLVGAIVSELQGRGGDGVNVDFEGYMGQSEQSAFTIFITELQQGLRSHVPGQSYLSIDTFATAAMGGQEGTMFDLAGLTPYTDAFDAMEYEFTGPGSGLTGPEAPLDGDWYNVRQSVVDYERVGVPAAKLIIGIPYYGVKWSITGCTASGCPERAQVTCCGQYDTYSASVDDLACAAQLHTQWDPTFAEPWDYWYSPAVNDPCGGNHGSWREMFYENRDALGAKYDLVNSAGLRGIGIWALGYDSGHTELWDEIAAKFAVTHAPTYVVTGLPATESSTAFNVSWVAATGSPPASHVTVYVRDGSGPWTRWVDNSYGGWTFFGLAGHAYGFFAQAFGPGGVSAGGPGPTAQATTSIAPSATRATPFVALEGVDADGATVPGSSPPFASASFTPAIARGIALSPGGLGGYTLDGWGGVHAFGSASTTSITAYNPNWDIYRGIVVRPDGRSGYVLDGWGGVHPFGGAPEVIITAYNPNWDIYRGIVLRPDGTSGYTLDGWGGIHPFGVSADIPPDLAITAYNPGWDIYRGIVLTPDGKGGYTLDGWGGVHQLGNAPHTNIGAYWSGWDIARGITLLPAATSAGYVLDGWGGIHPFGGAPQVTLSNYTPGQDVARGISAA